MPGLFWTHIGNISLNNSDWQSVSQTTEFLLENNCFLFASSMQPFFTDWFPIWYESAVPACVQIKMLPSVLCIFSAKLSITKRELAKLVQQRNICFPSEFRTHLNGSIKTKLLRSYVAIWFSVSVMSVSPGTHTYRHTLLLFLWLWNVKIIKLCTK